MKYKTNKIKQLQQRSIRRKSKWKQMLAKAMRDFPTPSEALCKATLLQMGFRHQAIILGYIPDFAHFSHRIIVEIEGPIHEQKKAADLYRDEVFKSHLWRVLRFTNQQVNKHPDQVYERVKAAVNEYSR